MFVFGVFRWFVFAVAAAVPTVACSNQANEGDERDAATADNARGRLIFELRKPLGLPGNPVASYNYICLSCADDLASAYDAATLPAGTERVPWREMIAARTTMRPVPGLENVEPLDILPQVEGAEFVLAAAPQEGVTKEGWVFLWMKSDRTISWDAGDVVHEITDGKQVYVAFALLRGTDPAALNELPLPTGWSYRSRKLDAPLTLDAHGAPRVALNLNAAHLWQLR